MRNKTDADGILNKNRKIYCKLFDFINEQFLYSADYLKRTNS